MAHTPPCRTPTPLNPEQEATLREWIAWRAANEVPQERAAGLLGCSHSTLSSIESGSYAGRTGAYVAEMRKVLDRHAAEAGAIQRPPHIVTTVSTAAFGVFDQCFIARRMGFLCGNSGVGKTEAARAYAAAHPTECVLITCCPGFTARDVIRHIGNRLGEPLTGTRTQQFDQLVEALCKRGRPLLLVDEVDYASREAADTVRHLHDKSGCGVVLVGTPTFLANLRKRPTGREGQLLGRLTHCVNITRILGEDVDSLAGFFSLSSTALRRASEMCAANARRLVSGLVVAAEFAGGGQIGEQHVTAAFNSLMPLEV